MFTGTWRVELADITPRCLRRFAQGVGDADEHILISMEVITSSYPLLNTRLTMPMIFMPVSSNQAQASNLGAGFVATCKYLMHPLAHSLPNRTI